MINQLLQATWRGVPFFIRSEGMTEGGRRIIIHEYPNSNRRYVEDLGELPPKFKITAFVSGSDYRNDADSLETALKEPGKGRLTMPVFGSAMLYALPYRKDATQTAVGEINFELEFVQGEALSGPVIGKNTTATVFAYGDEARLSIGDAFERAWKAPYNPVAALIDRFNIGSLIEKAKVLKTKVENVTAFVKTLKHLDLNKLVLVHLPGELRNFITNDLMQIISLGQTGVTSLFDLIGWGSNEDFDNCPIYGAVGDDIPLWEETTTERILRNQNRQALVDTIRTCVLVNLYEQAANKNYNTVDEIEQTQKEIENYHTEIMRVDTANRNIIQSNENVRTSVENVRIAALDVMAQKEQAAFSTTSINRLSPTPVFLLSYQLYAETLANANNLTQNAITVRGLNPDKSSNRAVGTLQVLQS